MNELLPSLKVVGTSRYAFVAYIVVALLWTADAYFARQPET